MRTSAATRDRNSRPCPQGRRHNDWRRPDSHLHAHRVFPAPHPAPDSAAGRRQSAATYPHRRWMRPRPRRCAARVRNAPRHVAGDIVDILEMVRRLLHPCRTALRRRCSAIEQSDIAPNAGANHARRGRSRRAQRTRLEFAQMPASARVRDGEAVIPAHVVTRIGIVPARYASRRYAAMPLAGCISAC